LLVQKGIVVGVGKSDSRAIVELELVQMGPVPSGKRIINGSGELTKLVSSGGGEESTWSRPEMLAAALD